MGFRDVEARFPSTAAEALAGLLFGTTPQWRGSTVRLSDLVSYDTPADQGPGPGVRAACAALVRGWLRSEAEAFSGAERRLITDSLVHALASLPAFEWTAFDAAVAGWRSTADQLHRACAPGLARMPRRLFVVYRGILDGLCLHLLHAVVQKSPWLQRVLPKCSTLATEVERLRALTTRTRAGMDEDEAFERRYLAESIRRYQRITLVGAGQDAGRPTEPPLDLGYISRAVVVRGDQSGAGAATMALEEVLATSPRVLLRGPAGAGKSASVTWLAAAAAAAAEGRGPGFLQDRVPFVLPVRALRARHRELPAPEEFLAAAGSALAGTQPTGWVQRVLAQRRGLILVDGVDEVPDEDRDMVGVWLERLVAALPEALWLVTSRPAAVPADSLVPAGFTDLSLGPMDEEAVAGFIRRWHRSARIGDPGDDRLPDQAEELIAALRVRGDLADLATSPLLCALICELNRSGQLPAARTGLYTAVLTGLLSRRDPERTSEPSESSRLSRQEQTAVLQRLAYWQVRNAQSEMDVATAVALGSKALPMLRDATAAEGREEVFRHFLVVTGALWEPAAGRVSFVHRAIRDYLAAQAVLADRDFDLLVRHALNPEWRDVVRNAVALARPSEAAALVRGLLERGDGSLPRSRRVELFVLAAEAVQEAAGLDPRVSQAVRSCLASMLPPRDEAEARAFAQAGAGLPGLLPVQADGRTGGPARDVGGTQAAAVLRWRSEQPNPASSTPVRRRRPELPALTGGARQLAVALSVATRIEPELIRAVRLRVFPYLDAGDEADLWFSPWAGARTRTAMALRPEVLAELRDELARKLAESRPDDPIRTVGGLIAETHVALSPALLLEERVNWIVVCAGSEQTTALEEALRPALRALVDEGRDGVGDWLAGAWQRLPAAAKESVTAWQLVTAAGQRLPELKLEQPRAPERISSADVALVADLLPDVALPVSREGRLLHLGPATAGAPVMMVPDTHPRVLDLLPADGAPGRVRTVTVAEGDVRTLRVGEATVRLRTARGAVYEFPAPSQPLGPVTGTSAASPGSGEGPVEPVGVDGSPNVLLRGPASVIADQALSGVLALRLAERFLQAHGRRPSQAALHSWERSVPALANALVRAGLGAVEVLLEYGLPLTSRSADAVLAGVHPDTGEPSYVVVELKAWSAAEPVDDGAELCRADGYGRAVVNPIEQVRSHCEYLVSINESVAAHPERVCGVAYLYNATEFGVSGLLQLGQSEQGRLFTAERSSDLRAFLRARLRPESGAPAADQLLAGNIRPPRQLMAVAAELIRGQGQFILLGQQRLAYETVMQAVGRTRRSEQKEVIVITGGPGTGKSVVALALLGELHRRGNTAVHATGSRSFTQALRELAGARSRESRSLFRYFNSFTAGEPNSLDVLICDEAHRIRETSPNRFAPAHQRAGRPQIDELIEAARVPVFLLDEHQIVQPGEVGGVELIRAAAAAQGLDCRVVALGEQFRFGGSDVYVEWVGRLLGLTAGGPVRWDPDGKVVLGVAESPEELDAFLAARQTEGYTARMTAGYCWPRTGVPQDGPLPLDVRIDGWARPWCLFGDRAVAGAPPSSLWATDPAGSGQVGLVYTAQGHQFDWSGVILGPDLVWRTDRWLCDRTASRDPAFGKGVSDADVDRMIRNSYRILLTRGMVGTVLYSTDPETRAMLRGLTPP